MRILALAALLVGMGAGCYSPSYADCEVSCATSNICPSGYTCNGTVCRVEGASGACAGTDGGGGDGGIQPVDFYTQVIAAQCKLYARCGVFETEAACVETLTTATNFFANLEAAIAMGKVRFDGEAAQRCFESYDQIACTRDMIDSSRARSTACLGVFAGTVDAGGACAIDEECVSQSCSVMQNCPAGSCCTGTCVGSTPPGVRAVGEACDPKHDLCQNGFCDETDPNGPRCRDYLGQLAVCTSSEQCAAGLYCNQNAGNSQCMALSPTGSSCSSNATCLNTGDTCRNGSCVMGGLTGTPCDQATMTGCQDFHICNVGKCDLPPGAGEPCAFQSCAASAYCNAQGICTARDPDGSACTATNNYCASFYCDTDTMMCAQPPVCT